MLRTSFPLALTVLISAGLTGCPKSDPSGSGSSVSAKSKEADISKAGTPASSAGNIAAANSKPAAQANTTAVTGWPSSLPKLGQVLKKPFPDGASEQQVCDAIDNTKEKDLWVRFGYLIPMHIFGSLFVLEAGERDAKKVLRFLVHDYGGYQGRVAVCKNKTTLLYLRGFTNNHESHGKIVGREDLVQKLQEALELPVRGSFTFDDDQERLSDYCRADANLCEQLVKLDYANKGKGLCSRGISRARLNSVEPAVLLERCARLPRKDLACTEYAFAGSDAAHCRTKIRELLTVP